MKEETKKQIATVFKPIEDRIKIEQPPKEKKEPAKLVGCYI